MKKYIWFILIYYFILLVIRFSYYSQQPVLSVKVLDVGQGDSILINYENKFRVLVDAGTGENIEDLLLQNFLLPVCNLDVVYISHLHFDHFGGMLPILEKCNIGILWFNDVPLTTKVYKAFDQKIKDKKNINKINSTISTGNRIDYGDLKIITLWPTTDFYKNLDPKDDLNQASTVLFVDYKGFELVLTGDAESEVLDRIDWNQVLPLVDGGLDVFKVPHHGSKKGMSTALLALLKPKTCVISLGTGNGYGHPSATALSLLHDSGCAVRRTDLEGTIEFNVN
jgi:competence protein ComEC